MMHGQYAKDSIKALIAERQRLGNAPNYRRGTSRSLRNHRERRFQRNY